LIYLLGRDESLSWPDHTGVKNEKLKKKKEKTTVISMIHQEKMMGKIGVDRSEELKNNTILNQNIRTKRQMR